MHYVCRPRLEARHHSSNLIRTTGSTVQLCMPHTNLYLQSFYEKEDLLCLLLEHDRSSCHATGVDYVSKVTSSANLKIIPIELPTWGPVSDIPPVKSECTAACNIASPAVFNVLSACSAEGMTALCANTRPSSKLFEANLLAPWRPVWATSPAANRPATLLVPSRLVCKKNIHQAMIMT